MNGHDTEHAQPAWLIAFNTAVQMLVTGGLLVLAYTVRAESQEVFGMIVGAAIAHWLREAAVAGRAINAPRTNGHDETPPPRKRTR